MKGIAARYKPKDQIPSDFFCCDAIMAFYELHKNDTIIVYPETARNGICDCNCCGAHYRITFMSMKVIDGAPVLADENCNSVDVRIIDIDEGGVN